MRSLLLVGAACASGVPVTPPLSNGELAGSNHELMVTLERTACFGWCPVYTIRVFRDGIVEYEGDNWVKITGSATGRISAARLATLDKVFAEAHFFALADRYMHPDFTDNPSAITSYRRAGRDKQVEHDLGDHSAPAALEKLEDAIDRLVEIEHWIGTEEERRRSSHM